LSEEVAWVFKYNPKNLDDMVMLPNHKALFQKLIDGGLRKPILLYGDPGIGKTTLCEIILKKAGTDIINVNGSDATSVDFVRDYIRPFTETASSTGKNKIVFIDEFDRMSPQAKDALKKIITKSIGYCGFLFATNYLHAIDDANQSRCDKIDLVGFKTAEDKMEMAKMMYKRCVHILKSENVDYLQKALQKFIMQKSPAYRDIIMSLQLCYDMYGKIDENIIEIEDVFNDKMIECIRTKDIDGIISIINNSVPNNFYSNFYSSYKKLFKVELIPEVIICLADYSNRNNTCADKHLNLAGCMFELLRLNCFKF